MPSNARRCSPLRIASLIAFGLAPVAGLRPMPVAAQPSPMELATAGLEWREIGPTIMGGRIADVAVVESDPSTFYVGAATGGVWKTVNGGTSFEPVFGDEPTASIGDVTIAPSNPNVVWVGTGEPQNRQSSPWGMGVFRSVDAGRTWTHTGLENTHHIARIQVDPGDPDIAYVAAVGHLWGPSPDRGVYRTLDGGGTWELVLHIDDDTGAIDLAMDPGDPRTLFAAMYQRRRTLWGFNGGGPGSGIYRTLDGGDTWEEMTEGLPEGDMGRIGLDIYRGDGNLVYAVVEADPRRPGQGFGGSGGGERDRKNGVYRSTDRGATWEQVSNTNNRPMYYSQIRIDPNDPDRIYLGGAQLYRSSDGGRTFTNDAAQGVHSDHHALWIDPSDSDHLILGGDGGVSVSWDRSDSWRQLRNLPVAQFYEIGVDGRDPYHVCGGLQDNGSWCAPSDTWSSQGIRPRDWYNVGSGDGFFTVMHPTEPVMLAESQGGNITRVNLVTRERLSMRPVARPLATEEGEEDRTYRFNWDSPIVLSTHDPNTIYLGGNHVFRSTDMGQSWQEISPDLTKAIDRTTLAIMGVLGSEPMMSANDGTSSFGNLVSLAESPLDPNVLYAGSDDGNLQVTRDGGATWTNVAPRMPGLPDMTYLTRIVASHADAGTVWAAGDNHRNDDFAPYLYVSRDYGETWRRITDGLPDGWSVNALLQHPRDADLLFTGNEVGIWFSIDAGESWHPLRGNLPTVPVDDIRVQPRENDLVIGTHGRGIWIMEDITPLEDLSEAVLASAVHLFPVRRATEYNPYRPQGWTPGIWAAENPPYGARIRYWLGSAAAAPVVGEEGAGGVSLTVLGEDGEVIRTLRGQGERGLHEVVWDLRWEPPYESEGPQQGGGGFFFGGPIGPRVLPGTYTVRLEAGGEALETEIEVRLDPRVEVSPRDLAARQEAMMRAYAMAKPANDASRALRRLRDQLRAAREQLGGHEEAPSSLGEEADAIGDTLDGIGEDLGVARRGTRVQFTLESYHGAPTEDALWQLDRGWTALEGAVGRLNAVITDRMPAFYRALDENGIRPDPGAPIEIPRPPGG